MSTISSCVLALTTGTLTGGFTATLEAILAGHVYNSSARAPGLEDGSVHLQTQLASRFFGVVEGLFAALHLVG